MENRIDRKDVSFATVEKHDKEEREYWSKASVEEKLQAITYLRECFYGPEATTGRFKEFIHFLNAHNVCYLLVGGWAVGIYGYPRATKDIDFLIAINDENLARLKKALREFGTPEINMGDFKEKGYVFRMGRSPIQIDIINEASGIDILDCYTRRNIITIDGLDISLISKNDLIKNKKASGRNRDLADVDSLEGRNG